MARIVGDLPDRTLDYAVAILDVATGFPNNPGGWVVGKQLVRSGTSIGANVREADYALTGSDFAYCCNVARKEAAETRYWLDLSERARLLPGGRVAPLRQEADELVRVLSSVVKKSTARLHRDQGGTPREK